MKISSLKLINFAKFNYFECEFNGNITRLVGVNGAGKTTIGLTSIWACFKGISERTGDGQLLGERYRFIGNQGASADIEITLIDEQKNAEIKVRNHITKQGNKITFEAPEGYRVNDDWLNEILSIALLSAKNFSLLSSEQQALELGIDTSEYDNNLAGIKQEYTILNRELKSFGEIEPVEKVEPVLTADLLTQKEEIDDYNNKQRQLLYERKQRQNEIEKFTEQMDTLKDAIKILENQIAEAPEPRPLIDPTTVVEKINNSWAINEQANAYKDYISRKEQKDSKHKELDANKIQQNKILSERLKYIKDFNFDFANLEVDDKGGLVLNGRPIKEPYFSKGELELIVAKLYVSQNPKLKMRFIDDFELLDEDNQKNIVDSLLQDGFQIITAEVGKIAKHDNSIILRECKIVEEYQEQKETLL